MHQKLLCKGAHRNCQFVAVPGKSNEIVKLLSQLPVRTRYYPSFNSKDSSSGSFGLQLSGFFAQVFVSGFVFCGALKTALAARVL